MKLVCLVLLGVTLLLTYLAWQRSREDAGDSARTSQVSCDVFTSEAALRFKHSLPHHWRSLVLQR